MADARTGAASVDRDVPDIVEAMVKEPWAMVKVDPRAELEAFEATAQLLRSLVPASIKATRPQDWVKMGDKVYLQATGVERIAPLWGLVFGEPHVTREDYPDGEFGYIVRGGAGSRKTGVFYGTIEGGRSSRDPFFDSFDEEKPGNFRDMTRNDRDEWKRAHRIPPDPLDVRKAAVTNWLVRSASMLTGLRGLLESDLASAGISGIAQVQFSGGKRGGDAKPADLKAKATALWNDILKRTGGDLEAARQILKEITSYSAYEKDGKTIPAYAGAKSAEDLRSERAIEIAERKLKSHSKFGDTAQRDPGAEG